MFGIQLMNILLVIGENFIIDFSLLLIVLFRSLLTFSVSILITEIWNSIKDVLKKLEKKTKNKILFLTINVSGQ